jgi:ATP-binding cassette subfamily D (ALD) long-chain fatty acid import protein
MANFSKPLLESLKAPGSRKPLIVILATVLLLRSRLLSLPKKALSKLPTVLGEQRLSQQELADALQQVYVKEEDGSKTILVPYRDRISKVQHLFCLTKCILNYRTGSYS